jgi:hypothetical protein
MKREWFVLGSIGLGAGLMYWMDPARGRQRRARTRAQFLSASHRVGDLLEDATSDLRPLHLPQWRRMHLPQWRRAQRPSSLKWGRPHTGFDIFLLILGGVGLSAICAWLARPRQDASLSGEPASAGLLQSVCDWACGVWDGVGDWFQPAIETTNTATDQPSEREREVTMMGVEAESTKEEAVKP